MAAQATADTPADLQFHGFVSQALIYTSSNNFFGETDDHVDTGFTELGVNGSWRLNPHLQVSAQLLSRRAGEGDDGDPRLDYGFANLSTALGDTGTASLLLGKSKIPYGLYNDTRDVAFTRPSVLLPQSIYFDRTRNLALALTGIQGIADVEIGGIGLALQGGFGEVEASDRATELAFLGSDRPGRIESDSTWVVRAILTTPDSRWRFAYTEANVGLNYSPGTDPLGPGRMNFMPRIVSAQFNAERWSLATEYAHRKSRFSEFAFAAFNSETEGESYYLQGGYRFVPRWEGFVRYDVFYADRSDKDGSRYAAAAPGRVPYSRFAKDWTAGVRWDTTDALTLRLEFHHVDGTGWLPREDNPGTTERRWNMWLFQAAYRF